MKGIEKWRIAQAWGSFAYLDEPRSYYDEEKKNVILLDPKTGEKIKRQYQKKEKKK